MRRLLLLIFAVSTLIGLFASPAAAHTVDLDCSHFGFQAAAQDHKDVHAGDPDGLDHDKDGIACEDELPCPCFEPAAPAVDLTPVGRPARLDPLGAAPTAKARVVRVIDGDALAVKLTTGKMVKVRLIGVDAGGATTAAARCTDTDAVDRMRRLGFRKGKGRSVTLKIDPTQAGVDGSGRLLAYVNAGHVDFGRTMISSGAAKLHVSARDFLRASAYRKAEAAAKSAKRGVWRSC